MNDDERTPETVIVRPEQSYVPAARAEVVDAEFRVARGRRLRSWTRLLFRYRWLAGTCFGVTVGLAALVTLVVPRAYTAATRLQVTHQAPLRLQVEERELQLDSNTTAGASFLATQVAALRSRDLAERVIRGRRLGENPAFLRPAPERGGLVWASSRMLTLLRPRGWTGDAAPASEQIDAGSAEEVDARLLDRYLSYLDVGTVPGTDLVEVRFTTPSPSLSAFLAATHAEAYVDANEEARLASNLTTRDALDRQIAEARGQVERAESDLDRFAREHPSVAVNQEQKLVAQRTAELSELLSTAEAERVALESRNEFLSHADSEPLAFLLDRPAIAKLHGTLLDLETQEAPLTHRFGPNHPQMVDLRRQQAAVQRQLATEVAGEIEAVRASYDAARLRETAIRRKLAHQERIAVALREQGSRYDMLKSDADSARALRESLLKQRMATEVNAQLATFTVRIIERSEVPRNPSRPSVPLNMTLGLAAGLVFAVGSVFACEFFDNSVKSSDDVEGFLELPTLATIPNFALVRKRAGAAAPRALITHAGAGTKGEDGGRVCGPELIVLHEPWSPIAESFRSMRTSVLFSAPGAPPKVILVTSAGAGEGKTVSSLNLATTLADAGSEVLLLDLDLRRPRCHTALGIENGRGLSSFLAGQVPLESVIHALKRPRFFFIPAGPPPPKPAELLGSSRMLDALDELRGAYDFLILDAPPVLPVTDATLLGREADGVVLVVKGHDTPRELVRRARDQLAQAGAHLLGAVVNNVDLGWGDLYFYDRYYGPYYRQPQGPGERA
ncbi:MAG TPA: polysaccharide biosynthesis tyrosine autokinase [Candidatus Nitrosopolaris sp.]|nr:polysaccharide biosynthesis tyrosine autokinase [Candidatus Nitrosopolaris sp.]